MKQNKTAIIQKNTRIPPSIQDNWATISAMPVWFWQDNSIENRIAQGTTARTHAKLTMRPYPITADMRIQIDGTYWEIIGSPKALSINEMELMIIKEEQG